MRNELHELIQKALQELSLSDVPFTISRPENPTFGDYTTNVAFLVAKALRDNPNKIANMIIDLLQGKTTFSVSEQTYPILQDIESMKVAGAGFINITLKTERISKQLSQMLEVDWLAKTVKIPNSETVMVEFAHPNTHKAFHIGHLRNIVTGECLVRLLKAVGNTVIRVNYQGDVGMHIAKCLYGILQGDGFAKSGLQQDSIEKYIGEVDALSVTQKVEVLAAAYVKGSKAYEENDAAKTEIGEINKKIYAKDSLLYRLYQKTRQWSLDYFETIYARVGTTYDRYYFESEVYEKGLVTVKKGVESGVFEESDGAIIFPGEKYGLHNRVFITQEGNPTYEGKEMGLAPLQFAEYHPDRIIHVVGPEQAGYFQVCFEAISQLYPEMKGKEFHQVYGWVKLKHGKMSSRTGEVVLGEWLLDQVKQSIYSILDNNDTKYEKEEREQIAERSAIAAVKYSFLKVGLSQEISFDIEESVNIHGDSGPYLLYTYARCQSVLRKVKESSHTQEKWTGKNSLLAEEQLLAKQLLYAPEIIAEAAQDLSPTVLCRYIFTLAQTFNAFYMKHHIIDEGRVHDHRLVLTQATAQTLKSILYLLGIETVERM